MRTILITGASSGIGRACAEKFSKKFNLVICSRNINNLKDIVQHNSNIECFELDVRNYKQVSAMFNLLDKKGIIPDVLINAAGLAIGLDEISSSNESDWDVMIDTNIKGLLYVTKFTVERMQKVNSGHIVNLGSVAGANSYARGIVYSATKACVKSISDGLRKELVSTKIKVTNIQPGLVETNFSLTRFKGDHKKAKAVYKGICPLSAEDIANTIDFVINSKSHVQISEITIMPTFQASSEHIHRSKK